jgi:Protein of unknown function C-terminus (DUF2399)
VTIAQLGEEAEQRTRLLSAREREPWHYDHVAYEAAASAARPVTPLPGEPAATPWDPELATAIRIEEEITLDALLQDLSP